MSKVKKLFLIWDGVLYTILIWIIFFFIVFYVMLWIGFDNYFLSKVNYDESLKQRFIYTEISNKPYVNEIVVILIIICSLIFRYINPD